MAPSRDALRTAQTAWALLALVVAIAPLVSGQVPTAVNPAVTVNAASTAVERGPNESAVVDWLVSYNGATAGDVTLAVDLPDGWTAEIVSPGSSFTLDPGTQETVRTEVRAGFAGNVAPLNGSFVLQASVVDDASQGATGSDSISLAYIAPAPPPPPLPTVDGPLEELLAASGGVVLLLAAYGWQGRTVRLSPEEPNRRINSGHHEVVQVEVRNRSRFARTVRLRIRRLPRGWGGAFAAARVKLDGKESRRVPLYLKLGFDGPPRKVRLRLQARANAISPWLVSTRLKIDVVDVPIPPEPEGALGRMDPDVAFG